VIAAAPAAAAAASTGTTSAGASSTAVDGPDFGARSGVAVVAIELHAVEGDNQDLAPAVIDTAAVLVHIGHGEGKMSDVAILLIDADPLHVVPLVDRAIHVSKPLRARV
jgi:hypothetical protein